MGRASLSPEVGQARGFACRHMHQSRARPRPGAHAADARPTPSAILVQPSSGSQIRGDPIMAAPETVDGYLATLPADRRVGVDALRMTVRAAAPDAVETIAYSMPALRSHGGQFLLSYAAYKKHYSLFPASGMVIEALGADLAPYLAG